MDISSLHPQNSDFLPELEWFLPRPKSPQFSITIPNDNSFNLNQKLSTLMPKQITIGINSDGKILGLKEAAEGYLFQKAEVLKILN
jgi:hypothetical protein